ncbi:zinc-dependent alcohol dehydrogenase family protein [Haloarcula nitratireducens]|uniref:Zinc-dependent alcohol dehydrogenase family protein n=1 Tax=Haloarcula nitratireducens TaxID=2487749 RepID=A0AAW4PFZ4_9EURY|nr:zinc-dependent alcohol dehydrogenase family protein [Halomicroarcula nitratireducens]MBX0296395.1 zinc-dependent alcohol dehydrogenase family protein [Halomicroarcula nitratireducens]
MKSAVLTDQREVTVSDRERPSPGDDDVIVEIGACGVCMTDYHLYHGTFPAEFPVVPGHESAGEVVATGDGVSNFEEGDRVAVFPGIPCGECDFCKEGKQNLCENTVSMGGAGDEILDGAFAEYLRAPAQCLQDIGDLSYSAAAFAEPLACCIHGVDRADIESGDTIVIVGAGPIGLLLLQAFRASGAGTIIVSEIVDERREIATQLGADYVVDPTAESLADQVDELVDRVDVAVEAVGLPATIEEAHSLTSPGGTTLVFGVPPQNESIKIDPFELYYRELEMVGVFALTQNTFSRAVTLLQGDRIETERLVTDELGLDGLQTAFDQMENNEGLKKMIYPNGR